MDCSERTKRRKISARVEEHFCFLENDSIEPLDDFLVHDSEHDISTDTFYDVCDHSEFENLVHNAEDEMMKMNLFMMLLLKSILILKMKFRMIATVTWILSLTMKMIQVGLRSGLLNSISHILHYQHFSKF